PLRGGGGRRRGRRRGGRGRRGRRGGGAGLLTRPVGHVELLGREGHRRPGGRGAAGGARPGRARRALDDRAEDLLQLLLAEGLLLQQREDQVVQDVAVLDEDLPRLVVRGLDQLLDLLVDQAGDLLGVVALV